MKKTILSIVFCAILIVPNYSQDNVKEELNNLNRQVVSLYKEGKLNEAIKVSDKIIDVAKRSDLTDKETMAVYIAMSGRLKKEMYQTLLNKLNTVKMERDDYFKTIEEANEYAIAAEEDFENAVKMFDDLKSDSRQAAFAKSQYAWILHNHPGKPKRKIRTDPNKLERYEDAEKLYLESLASNDKTLGKDSDVSILASFDIAEFYLNWLKFEESIPLYERFIQSIETKYGKDQESLAPALKSLADIMITTDRESEAKKLAERIIKITGEKQINPQANFNLQLRKKYSASYDTQAIISRVAPSGNLGSVASRQGLLRGGEFGATGTQYTYSGNASINIQSTRVLVKVLIDEKGNVIEAEAVESDKSSRERSKLEEEARKKVKGWRFEPFVHKGKAQKMRGYVTYISNKVRA